MGFCAEPTEAMGPFFTEIRRESFVLTRDGDEPIGWGDGGAVESIELRKDDIAFIRAALDQVEQSDQYR